MENVLTGDGVDLFRFPTPRYHASDGGRYLGTGSALINRDPDSGYVNIASRGRGLDLQGGGEGLRDLRAHGIQDVVGVGNLMHYIRVIAIRQRFPGHAKHRGGVEHSARSARVGFTGKNRRQGPYQ